MSQADVVVDGRDIGTVVFPDAPLKVFLVADPEVRGALRWDDACVMVDPPRAGLGKPVLGALAELRPRTVIYLSCDPATLARDAGTLVSRHGFRLRGAGIMDMFPHTGHVEAVTTWHGPHHA